MRPAFRHARHMSVRAGHYAVLIDADNVPPRLCAAILEEVGQRVQGTNVDRRVYGDFSLPRIEAWKTAALEHGIATIMQTSPSKTKNATDIALCIDAMDILHAPNSLVDTFVLVTNDGDFAPLAQRLRRSGKRVVAVGTGASLLASCDAHVPLDLSRTPQRLHTAADVALLEEVLYDLATGSLKGGDGDATSQHDDLGEGFDNGNTLGPGRWIDISVLANAVDRLRPGWRRGRVQDFLNFRHLLECEPYRSSFSLRAAHNARGTVHTKVQLRPHVRESVKEIREQIAAEKDKEEEAKEAKLHEANGVDSKPLAKAKVDEEAAAPPSMFSWLWGGGGSRSSSAAESASSMTKINGTAPSDTKVYGGPDDVSFVTSVLTKALINGDCASPTNGKAMEKMDKRRCPVGDGWVHLSPFAGELDKEAVATGRGKNWREAAQGPSLKSMLSEEPYASAMEIVSIRSGPSSVDVWVRMKPGAGQGMSMM